MSKLTSINLTRVECKYEYELPLNTVRLGINLTRVECKFETRLDEWEERRPY